jgi:NifU-like protein involved in Fe-S cluster formation
MTRYSTTVAEHFEDPRNKGVMENPDAVGSASVDGRPPSATIYLRVVGQRIEKATFQTQGCGFMTACCSALTEMLTGRRIGEARAVTADDLMAALDGLPRDREFCAHLATAALADALAQLLPAGQRDTR